MALVLITIALQSSYMSAITESPETYIPMDKSLLRMTVPTSTKHYSLLIEITLYSPLKLALEFSSMFQHLLEAEKETEKSI